MQNMIPNIWNMEGREVKNEFKIKWPSDHYRLTYAEYVIYKPNDNYK